MENLTRREREKQVREDEIIAAAEKIFCLKGFENASMEEIAIAAQFTKRTLYQYFANKEDLYFAAALKGFKKLFAILKEASMNEQTGYMKIYKSTIGYYRFYKEYPEIMTLIGYVGHVRKNSTEESQRQKELMQFDDTLFQSVISAIIEGKADGSIRKDLDPVKVSFSIIFMMTGFFNQLSITGDTFTEKFSLNQEDFSLFSMDLLLSSIKNNN